jgi:hypothetical protein
VPSLIFDTRNSLSLTQELSTQNYAVVTNKTFRKNAALSALAIRFLQQLSHN